MYLSYERMYQECKNQIVENTSSYHFARTLRMVSDMRMLEIGILSSDQKNWSEQEIREGSIETNLWCDIVWHERDFVYAIMSFRFLRKMILYFFFLYVFY